MTKSINLSQLEEMAQAKREDVTITCYLNWKNVSEATLNMLASEDCPLFEGLNVRKDYLVGNGDMANSYRVRGNADDVLKAFNRLREIAGLHASISKVRLMKPLSFYKQLEGKKVATKVLIRGREGDADTLEVTKVTEDRRATYLYSVTVANKKGELTFTDGQLSSLLDKGNSKAQFIEYTLL